MKLEVKNTIHDNKPFSFLLISILIEYLIEYI